MKKARLTGVLEGEWGGGYWRDWQVVFGKH